MKTAKFIRKLEGWRGNAGLYKLSEPVEYLANWSDTETTKTSYVVVSAVYAHFSGNETFIFPADVNGNVFDWGELPGSYRDGLDPIKALNDAGYQVTA